MKLVNVTLQITRDDNNAASGDVIVKGILSGLLSDFTVTNLIVSGTQVAIQVSTADSDSPTVIGTTILSKIRASGINANLVNAVDAAAATTAVAQVNNNGGGILDTAEEFFQNNKTLVLVGGAIAAYFLFLKRD